MATSNHLLDQHTAVYAEQANLLHELAEKSDCIIVGCSADYLLGRDKKRKKIFEQEREA